MKMKTVVAAFVLAIGCSSSPTSTGFKIQAANGSDVSTAVAGDAIALQVVETFDDGSTMHAEATMTSPTTVVPLDPDSTADSPIPAFGATPTAIFINNTLRPDRNADLAGVLFVLDAGTTPGGSTSVTATIGTETAALSFAVGAAPAGDASRGSAVYAGACAECHGSDAQGTPQNPDGTYTIDSTSYPFPAPGLDTEPGNLGGDPAWNAALLAVAARSDMDNGGLELRSPMPDWLTEKTTAGAVLSTQDFADIYAFLMTQPSP
jgi:Cytochrome c